MNPQKPAPIITAPATMAVSINEICSGRNMANVAMANKIVKPVAVSMTFLGSERGMLQCLDGSKLNLKRSLD